MKKTIAVISAAASIAAMTACGSPEPDREQLFEAGKQACYTELMERIAESQNRAVGWEGKHGALIEQGETSGYMEFEIEVVTSALIPWKQMFHCDFDASTIPATVTSLNTTDPQ